MPDRQDTHLFLLVIHYLLNEWNEGWCAKHRPLILMPTPSPPVIYPETCGGILHLFGLHATNQSSVFINQSLVYKNKSTVFKNETLVYRIPPVERMNRCCRPTVCVLSRQTFRKHPQKFPAGIPTNRYFEGIQPPKA